MVNKYMTFFSMITILFILNPLVAARKKNEATTKDQECLVLKANVPIRPIAGHITKAIFIDTSKADNNKLFEIELQQNQKLEDENGKYIILSDENIKYIKEQLEAWGKKGTERKHMKLLEYVKEEPQGQSSKFKLENEIEEEVYPEEKPPEESPQQPQEVATETQSLSSFSADQEKWKKSLELMGKIDEDFKSRKSRKNFVAIIFDDELRPYHISRYDVSEGDLIYVGVIFMKDLSEISVEFLPCFLEPEVPQLFVGDELSIGAVQLEEYKMTFFPPRQCYNSNVEITIKAKRLNEVNRKPESIQGRYNLKQYKRYRGTIQVGILFSDQHRESFGLKIDGAIPTIYNKGPIDKGPEYVASVIIYSFPRYIEDIFSGKTHFSGRNIIHDQKFLDRIGAVFGVGLSNPKQRFILGFSFEVIYGVNLIGAWEFVKLRKLPNNLKEGDEFSGTEEEIPLQDYWENSFMFGVSLDLRYITALFTKK